MMELPNYAGQEPLCKYGYTNSQIEEIMGDDLDNFIEWMYGQTMMICEGRAYNHETKEYEEACGGVSHGTVFFNWDVQRYLEGGLAKEYWD